MKQYFVIVLLCLLLLSGCGQADQPSDATLPPETVPTETAETEPVVTEPVETEPVETEPAETEPTETEPEPEDADFVKVTDYIPDLLVELKYASPDNFVGFDIYHFSDVYLRYGTVKKLAAVQEQLSEMGLRLKIWDGFRPVSAQYALWEVKPDPAYVANPTVKKFSSHSHGHTVDVTLADAQGHELAMPTEFDTFSSMADRDYSDCGEEEAENATLLQDIMMENGFTAYFAEWWHFSDATEYPAEEFFDPSQISRWFANCQEYISLRVEPDVSSDTIIRILKGEEVTLLGHKEEFALVEYEGQKGYVLSEYLLPSKDQVDSQQKQYISLNRPLYRAVCENFISLRAEADVSSEVITQIPVDGTFIMLEWSEPFALVDYNGLYGYVLLNYIEPA